MIIVTGASGHLGNVLVRYLLTMEKEVGVVDLDPQNDPVLKDLPVKMYKGDVRDLDFLIKTFSQAEYVFHLAGIVAISPGKEDLMYDVNINGTKNVVAACMKTGIKRLVYTSSVHALHEPPKGIPLTEKLGDPEKVLGPYAKTKILGTREIFKGIKAGLNAVITYPSGVIGPYDFKGSEMGNLINDYIKGKFRFYLDGAYNFVDVRDIARGLWLAKEKGKSGEDYILSGYTITVKELFRSLSELTGIKQPKFRMQTWFAKFVAPLAVLYYRTTKTTPVFTPYSINVLNSNAEMSFKKASADLGYTVRPLIDTLSAIIRWRKGQNIEI
ncbi:NAD-dependent epimerase/dehydratase family protein [Candidatus Dojkabacteria bacterium]|nr:NAD-dependent epimerase/dehydratase family protein [Candidatus Dojkabacteria bacterium]